MFMGKDELKNLKDLIKLRFRINKWSSITLALVIIVFYVGNILPLTVQLLSGTFTATSYFVQDISFSFFIGLIVGLLLMEFSYGQSNTLLAVFPQTNNTRFISHQIFQYSYILLVALLFLIFYLLQYGFMRLITANMEEIMIAPGFDLNAIVSGLFVFILYAFLLSSILALCGTLIRRFKFYAMGFWVVALLLILTNMAKSRALISQALSFVTGESDLWLFFIKGFLLWVVIVTLSLWINKNTIYYQISHKPYAGMVLGGIILLLVLVTGPAMLFMTNFQSLEYGSTAEEVSEPWEGYEKITYDISNLNKGSKINLITNEHVEKMEYEKEYFTDSFKLYIVNYEVLESIQGDTLSIYYKLPEGVLNGFSLTNMRKPSFNAHLKGNTLSLDYTFKENRKAIIMPIWSIAGQFDQFYSQYRSQDTFAGNFGFSYSRNQTGSIYLEIE